MGNIGFPELLVILVLALVLFGAGRLPEVGRSLGRAIREFKEEMAGVVGGAEERAGESRRPAPGRARKRIR